MGSSEEVEVLLPTWEENKACEHGLAVAGGVNILGTELGLMKVKGGDS